MASPSSLSACGLGLSLSLAIKTALCGAPSARTLSRSCGESTEMQAISSE